MQNNDHDQKYELVGDVVSIFQRGPVWHANFQHEGRQQRKSLKTRSKKEARRQAVRLEAGLIDGRYEQQIRAPAIQKVIHAYMSHLRTERKAKKTLGKCELTFKRLAVLAAARKARTILDINLQFVDAYQAERVTTGAAPKTVVNETVIIRQLVNFALARSMINSDPLRNLKIKKPKRTRQPCWSFAERERILTAAKGYYRPALVLLAETGMRVGELKHLTPEDVDFEASVIHIRPKPGWTPKTGDQRVVPMSPRAREVLKCQVSDRQWVFTAPPTQRFPEDDRQVSERRLLQYLKKVLKRLGLEGHLHTFRHTFISNALLQGVPQAVVQRWVGHVDRETLEGYTRIADQDSQAAMQRLANSSTNKLQKKENRHETATTGTEVESAQIQHKEEHDAKG